MSKRAIFFLVWRARRGGRSLSAAGGTGGRLIEGGGYGGVAVGAVDVAGAADAHAGEEIAEDAVAAEGWGADEEGGGGGLEDVSADVDGAADAADGWGGVEGGADFVVDVAGIEG